MDDRRPHAMADATRRGPRRRRRAGRDGASAPGRDRRLGVAAALAAVRRVPRRCRRVGAVHRAVEGPDRSPAPTGTVDRNQRSGLPIGPRSRRVRDRDRARRRPRSGSQPTDAMDDRRRRLRRRDGDEPDLPRGALGERRRGGRVHRHRLRRRLGCGPRAPRAIIGGRHPRPMPIGVPSSWRRHFASPASPSSRLASSRSSSCTSPARSWPRSGTGSASMRSDRTHR